MPTPRSTLLQTAGPLQGITSPRMLRRACAQEGLLLSRQAIWKWWHGHSRVGRDHATVVARVLAVPVATVLLAEAG